MSKILKKLINVLGVIVILIVIYPIGLALGFRFIGGVWPEWTGIGEFLLPPPEYQPAKTLWDYLELLIVPFVLAVGAILFNKAESKSKIEIETKRAQESKYQNYLDKISNLWSSDAWSGLSSSQEARYMAKARTISVLSEVDINRRKVIVNFLRGGNLIGEEGVINLTNAEIMDSNFDNLDFSYVDLSKADLTGTSFNGSNFFHVILDDSNLSRADLSGAYLSEASLVGADLYKAKSVKANFSKADLGLADLHDANLKDAIFEDANLVGADLTGANLKGADFTRANLLHAKVSRKQLSMCKSIDGAILPH